MRFGWLSKLDVRLIGATTVGLKRAAAGDLRPPWPDLLITCGRRCLPVARWIKRRSRGRTRIVHIMRPSASTDIDLLVLPHHDRRLTTEEVEVLRVTGAPHRVRPTQLAKAGAHFKGQFAHLPVPRIALLVGGAARHVRYRRDWGREMAMRAAEIARSMSGSLMIATSRRTGRHSTAEIEAVVDVPHVLWKAGDVGENPYLGMVALADAIVVSADSVSMLSEACATGKPVFVYGGDRLIGHKLKMLISRLFKEGRIVALGDPFDHDPPLPLDTAGEVAQAIVERAGQWLLPAGHDIRPLSEEG